MTLPAPFSTLAELVDGLEHDRPAQTAVRFDGRTFTRGELAARARVLAAGWAAAGYAPGDVVGIVGDGGPAWLLALLSAGRGGLVPVLIDPRLPADQLETVVLRTGLRALALCGSAVTLPRAQPPVFSFNLNGDAVLQRLGGTVAPPVIDSNPHAPAVMLVTSGTSGKPRVVMLSGGNLSSNIRAGAEAHPCKDGEVFLSLLPATHAFELTDGVLGPLRAGAVVVFPASRNPRQVWKTMLSERVTHINVVPAMIQMAAREIHDSVKAMVAIALLRGRIRSIVCGGAPLSAALVQKIVKHRVPVWVGYGLTEASPSVATGRVCDLPPGSVGRALPGVELRVDPDSGELLVRGPSVMVGYAGEPAATASALRDGWLHTGDAARIDADGHLFIVGRLRDLIVTSAGTKLSPDRIEAAYQSPLFAEVCATGLTDPDGAGGESPHLVIVPATGVAAESAATEFRRLSTLAADDARALGMTVVAGALPRTRTLKIRRDLVRQMLPAPAGASTDLAGSRIEAR